MIHTNTQSSERPVLWPEPKVIISGKCRQRLGFFKKRVYQAFDKIRSGGLTIVDAHDQERTFGERHSALHVKCYIHRDEFFRRLYLGGSLALGESYMDGWWDVEGDRLVDLFYLVFQNKLEKKFKANPFLQAEHALVSLFYNPWFHAAAKRGVHRHYDLSNEFFALFLDESMTYSCGYQHSVNDSIEEMQRHKYDRISKKLGLQKGGRFLDIGCGWGGMLIHAVKSCKEITGLGTTLSKEQCELATKRIAAHGLQDRLEVKVCDYRDLVGSFDYVVSIGMFEHVGKPSYLTFMKKARDLLRPKGIGLLHTIAVTEDPSIETDTWIQEYIFPGGRLPRLEELTTTMREAGLLIGHVENWRPHYAKTLRRWHEKFSKNKERIRALGATFNERFLRMWDYYLQMSEASFCDASTELYQILFCREEQWNFPLRFEF